MFTIMIVYSQSKRFIFEFFTFAREYDFSHVTFSPKYPQSNGLAEKTQFRLPTVSWIRSKLMEKTPI